MKLAKTRMSVFVLLAALTTGLLGGATIVTTTSPLPGKTADSSHAHHSGATGVLREHGPVLLGLAAGLLTCAFRRKVARI